MYHSWPLNQSLEAKLFLLYSPKSQLISFFLNTTWPTILVWIVKRIAVTSRVAFEDSKVIRRSEISASWGNAYRNGTTQWYMPNATLHAIYLLLSSMLENEWGVCWSLTNWFDKWLGCGLCTVVTCGWPINFPVRVAFTFMSSQNQSLESKLFFQTDWLNLFKFLSIFYDLPPNSGAVRCPEIEEGPRCVEECGTILSVGNETFEVEECGTSTFPSPPNAKSL